MESYCVWLAQYVCGYLYTEISALKAFCSTEKYQIFREYIYK